MQRDFFRLFNYSSYVELVLFFLLIGGLVVGFAFMIIDAADKLHDDVRGGLEYAPGIVLIGQVTTPDGEIIPIVANKKNAHKMAQQLEFDRRNVKRKERWTRVGVSEVYFAMPSDEDMLWATRALAGEARGQSSEEIEALAHVMVNRVESGKYASTLKEVVLQADQFHSLTRAGDPNRRYALSLSRQDPTYKRIHSLLFNVVMERHLGVKPVGCLGRALNFYHPPAQPKWARKAKCLTIVGAARIVQTIS